MRRKDQIVENTFWVGIFDAIKTRNGYLNDLELGHYLDMHSGIISAIRNGHRPLPYPLKIQLLEEMGYEFDATILLRAMPWKEIRKFKVGGKCWNLLKKSESIGISGKDLPPIPLDH